MSAVIVKINKYLDAVKDHVKDLDIVHDCQLFNKQIDFSTSKVIGLPLFEGKATCLIDCLSSVVDKEASRKTERLIKLYTINIYIIAKNNKTASPTSRIGSVICQEAIDQIEGLLYDQDFDLNIEQPDIDFTDVVDNGSPVYVEYSIHYLQYKQRLTTRVRK